MQSSSKRPHLGHGDRARFDHFPSFQRASGDFRRFRYPHSEGARRCGLGIFRKVYVRAGRAHLSVR